MERLQKLWPAVLVFPLSGCDLTVLFPSGDIAQQQSDLILYSTILMLIVIVPVLALTVFFAFHYRASNKKAVYEPDWDHSISLEIVIWTVPMAIIITLAGLTWVATHRLNPYDDLKRISETKVIDPEMAPLTVHVVAMDWKWLFIYPEENIATVNELAAPVDRPIEFKITASNVTNAFYIPAMAGMIYAMPGMETELNAVINEGGVYDGFSTNYSGEGFSKMRFKFHALEDQAYDDWVADVQSKGAYLDTPALQVLNQRTIAHPVEYYNGIEETAWIRILNQCIAEDDLCLNDMMMVDALGGGGLDGLFNRELYRGICSADDPRALMDILRPDLISRVDEIFPDMANLLPVSLPVYGDH